MVFAYLKIFKLCFILNYMRRIKSQEDIEKRGRRNKLLVGGTLIFLMVFSTAGFALYGSSGGSGNSGSDSNQEGPYYNGQYWVYNAGGNEFYFTNNVDLAKSVSVEISMTLQNYAAGSLFIDSEREDVTNEISNNIGRFAQRIQRACYGPCEKDLPEKDCSENLVIWRESEENKVYQEENCVFIEGDLIAVDAFLYKVLGFI